MLRFVVDVLFPPRCLGCGGAGAPFCRECTGGLVALEPPGCRRCGRPFERDVERCRDCPPEAIDWSRSAFLYAGPVRAGLMRLKFSGWRSAARALAPALGEAARRAPVRTVRPTLTWVPLGRGRKRKRGFDQAEVLAKALGRELGWPVARLLARVRETAPQARRSSEARRGALQGAFVAVARPPPMVIVVDDILTTGETAAACAAALRQAGSRRIGVLTVARALGRALPAQAGRPAQTGRSPVVERYVKDEA